MLQIQEYISAKPSMKYGVSLGTKTPPIKVKVMLILILILNVYAYVRFAYKFDPPNSSLNHGTSKSFHAYLVTPPPDHGDCIPGVPGV